MKIITLEQLKDIEYSTIYNEPNNAFVNTIIDGIEQPVYIILNTVLLNENVHILSTKAYMDIYLNDLQIDYLQNFDLKNINTVIEKSEQWFGKPFPENIVKEYYNHFVNKKKKDNRYFCRLKINSQNNLPQFTKITNFYDKDGNYIDNKNEIINNIDEFTYQQIPILIEYKGLKFGRQTFNCDAIFNIIQDSQIIENITTNYQTIDIENQLSDTHIIENSQEMEFVNNNNQNDIDIEKYEFKESVQEEVAKELSEMLPEDLDKLVRQEDFSIRYPIYNYNNEQINYDFVREDEEPLENKEWTNDNEWIQNRKNILINRHKKYMNALEKLKNNVEEEVQKAVKKREKINIKYTEALDTYKQIELQSYFDPNDELIENEIIEMNGRLTPQLDLEEL